MDANDSKITSLQTQVKAAVQEFDMAVQFHEVWKPSAYDETLHTRMGISFATNAFHIVRVALRREMLLALMRLWDKQKKAVRMEFIAKDLRDKSVIDALVAKRGGDQYWESSIKQELSQRAEEAIKLVEKYIKNGSDHAVLVKLKTLRDENLAHRQIEAIGAKASEADSTDEEIESFYQDNSKLISLLYSLVAGVAYDPDDTAKVYRHYAKVFWAGVSGERTEGHPNYRK